MSSRLTTVLMVAGAVSFAAIALALVGRSGGEEPSVAAPAAGVSAPASPFKGSTMPPGVRVPDLTLRDQDGRPLRLRALRGRPWVVTFLYTNCELSCPPQAHQIKGALAELGRDVPVVAISVEPEEDTPAAARSFLLDVGMTDRMDFLLGTRRELTPAWTGFAIQPQTDDREHQARIALIDRDGFQRVGFPLDQATPERIAHDLRVLGA